jgi:cytosine deaminase
MACRMVDLENRVLLPRLVEPHCHLDKCHSISRLGPVGGDLHAAIAAQRADRVNCSAEDIRARAGRGLDELEEAGCGLVRSHIDWNAEATPTGEAPLAWHVLGDLAEERADRLTLQRAPLLSLEIFDDEAYTAALARRLAQGAGVLSVFVFDQTDKAARLRRVLKLAERHNLPLDFHVDEGLAPGLDGLVTIARLVIETGFQGPVLCGHACSLMNLSGAALDEALELIRKAGLAVAALPSTNLYLQGRLDATPERRGITRVRELAASGVPVTFGADNVGDAFCPIGRHDPLASLGLAALTAQLDPPYGPWLRSVTHHGRRALGQEALLFEGAAPSALLVSKARHTAELLSAVERHPLTVWLDQVEVLDHTARS